MKRVLRIVRKVVLVLLALVLLLYLLLRSAPVQTYITQKIAAHFSEALHTDISLGGVDISWFMALELKDLRVEDQRGQELLYVHSLRAGYHSFSAKEGRLSLNKVELDSLRFALRTYRDSSHNNLQFIVDYFMPAESDSSASPFVFCLEQLQLKGGYFVLDDENAAKQPPGLMDYAHLEVDDFELDIQDVVTQGEEVKARIVQLSGRERSGFVLDSMRAAVELGSGQLSLEDMKIQAGESSIAGRLRFTMPSWGAWLYFTDSVHIQSTLDSSVFNPIDLQYFSSALHAMDDELFFSGRVSGPVSNLHLRKITLAYGRSTRFEGRATMTGLPDVANTFFDFTAKRFNTSASDIQSFKLPGGNTLDDEGFLSSLHRINIKGRFTGFYNNFVANMRMRSNLGTVRTDLLIKPLSDMAALAYSGSFSLKGFDVGALSGISQVGRVTARGKVDGRGLDADARVKGKIKVPSIVIGDYVYHDAELSGSMEGRRLRGVLHSTDSIFRLSVQGLWDFSEALPSFHLQAEVHNARTNRMGLSDSFPVKTISGVLRVNITGNRPDNMKGYIKVDSLLYNTGRAVYHGDSILISSVRENNIRRIRLASKYVDGSIEGVFRFDKMKRMYDYYRDDFLSSFVKPAVAAMPAAAEEGDSTDMFFSFHFKDLSDLTQTFVPELKLSPDISFHGSYFYENRKVSNVLLMKHAEYKGFTVHDVRVGLEGSGGEFRLESYVGSLDRGAVSWDSLLLESAIFRDSLYVDLRYGKHGQTKNRGLLQGAMASRGSKVLIRLQDWQLYIQDTLWQLREPAKISYARHQLVVSDFAMLSQQNSLLINGRLSDVPNDKLNIDFQNFNLHFLDFYTRRFDTYLGGVATGQVVLSTPWKQMGFLGNLSIHDFTLNGVVLGKSRFAVSWNNKRSGLFVNGSIEGQVASNKMLDINGFYYPGRGDKSLSIDLSVQHFPLASVEPYLSSFTSRVVGDASGKIHVQGSPQKPVMKGRLKTDIRALRVDYLNTVYSLNDYLVFGPDYLGYEGVDIYDENYSGKASHKGRLNFKLTHQYFSHFALDLSIEARGLNLLQTSSHDNELYYGRAQGDGKVSIRGPLDDLSITMDMAPGANSVIAIPFSEGSEVASNSFVHFVRPQGNNDSLRQSELKKEDEVLAISLNLFFRMKPEATVQLIMDETVGDVITANGTGDIKLLYNKEGDMEMYGQYKVSKGKYLFTMSGIIGKNFKLKPGGYIRWDGDVGAAKINMEAVYRTEAKLYDLLQMVDSSSAYKSRSKVDCIIKITGTLSAPVIRFDIDLPEESSYTKDLVNMVLRTSDGGTNQDLMNKNFVSLIMLGSFQAPSGYEQGVNPRALASNATEMLANQMGNWLNNAVDNVDIGLIWEAGDEATNQELAVALSYQAFNNRLLIDGKFGTGGEDKGAENQTRIIGDINLEYKITPEGNLRLNVFNRTNYYDPLTRKAPYTQGGGLVYRREFDHFEELFRKKKKVSKKTEENP